MRKEEARRNKYCPDKSKHVSVEETEDIFFTYETKVSEVIEEVFEKCDKPKNVFLYKKLWIKSFLIKCRLYQV